MPTHIFSAEIQAKPKNADVCKEVKNKKPAMMAGQNSAD
jgi:hypothetical protein